MALPGPVPTPVVFDVNVLVAAIKDDMRSADAVAV
jgi:hypothetical protein